MVILTLEEDLSRLISDRNTFPIDYITNKAKETLTITILGEKGSGKTLFMAIIGLLYYYFNIKFYTNFYMPKEITSRKDFNIRALYNNPNVKGIFLDEVHNIADQNSNRTMETQLLVALFTQSRKRGQLIMMSSLVFYKLAKDLRSLTDLILYPKYNRKEDILYLTFWDIRTDKIRTRRIYKASRFFKYYNTYEIIVSEQIKSHLSSFLLKQKKLEKELQRELDTNDLDMLDNLEERMKE